MADPHGGHAQSERQHCVRARMKPFAVARQVEGLRAEGGEGGETAADAGHEESANGGGDQPATVRVRERGEEPDEERTRDVHDEGAKRERLSKMPRHKTRGPVPRDTAEPPAETDPEIIEHKKPTEARRSLSLRDPSQTVHTATPGSEGRAD